MNKRGNTVEHDHNGEGRRRTSSRQRRLLAVVLAAAAAAAPATACGQSGKSDDPLLRLVPAAFDYIAVFEGESVKYPYVLEGLVPQMFEDAALGTLLSRNPPARLIIAGWLHAFPHAHFLVAAGRFRDDGYEPAADFQEHLLMPTGDDGWYEQMAVVATEDAAAFEGVWTGETPQNNVEQAIARGTALVPPEPPVWMILSPEALLDNNPLAAFLGNSDSRTSAASAMATWLDALPPNEAVLAFEMAEPQFIEEMAVLISAITGSMLELTVEHEDTVVRIRIRNLLSLLGLSRP